MVKTIEFGDKKVEFSTSFAWAFIYKNQFKQDPAKVMMPTIRKINSADLDEEAQAIALYEELGFVGIVQIAWAMAKLCNRTLPEPLEWVKSFGDDFAPLDLVMELIPEAIESCFVSKNFQAPNQETEEEQKENQK